MKIENWIKRQSLLKVLYGWHRLIVRDQWQRILLNRLIFVINCEIAQPIGALK